MPAKRKRANLSRDTNKSRSIRNRRDIRTEEQVQEENTGARVRMAQLRQEQLDDTRAERNEVMRLEQRQSHRFIVNRRRANDQQRQQAHRAFVATSFLRLAFQYEPDIEYYAHSKMLDALLNEHNELLKIFKSHMHKLESDNHAIVINPDKTPAGEHIRRFNAPVADDGVAGIMVGDRTSAREIIIRRRNNNLQFIADTHRSYDALQYPLIFWKGQDGYSINIKQRDPVSGAETNKNVSSKDYYAYRLMIGRGLDNVFYDFESFVNNSWSTCTRR
ncbi:ATP-dependent DNA helicase [Nephila pilipes]|uniref:ATP-dependent DNA helicase n=1 Tax=Nephila pilipes TaxID=299642 RepID=A0A8X6U2R2_NEPPI|nr:ATP-dependent DNA helicase [Nephila pilipes]